MSKNLTPETEVAWVRLMRASQHIRAAIEMAFKAKTMPCLEWYDILLELKRVSPSGGLRPFELEQKLLLKQYNLSRQLARMCEADVIEKRPCPEDGRGYEFRITQAGILQQESMWPVYAGVLQDTIGSKLTQQEAALIAATLSKVSPDT